MTGRIIEEISVGDFYEESFYVDEDSIMIYAGVTGDHNPIHENDVYARQTVFQNRIAHGMLLGGYISKVLGMGFPGEGCIYLKQEMTFLKPVYIGEMITVRVEALEINISENRVTLSTQCFKNNKGIKCIDGRAVVLPKIK